MDWGQESEDESRESREALRRFAIKISSMAVHIANCAHSTQQWADQNCSLLDAEYDAAWDALRQSFEEAVRQVREEESSRMDPSQSPRGVSQSPRGASPAPWSPAGQPDDLESRRAPGEELRQERVQAKAPPPYRQPCPEPKAAPAPPPPPPHWTRHTTPDGRLYWRRDGTDLWFWEMESGEFRRYVDVRRTPVRLWWAPVDNPHLVCFFEDTGNRS